MDIEKFAKLYAQLNISYTPKVHILIDHVADFCDEFGSLGPFSTQSGESAHKNFKKTWGHYLVHETTSPELFQTQLLKAVNKYNAKHFRNSLRHKC